MSSLCDAEVIKQKDNFAFTLLFSHTCYLQITVLGLRLCYVTRLRWKSYFLHALLGWVLQVEGVDKNAKAVGHVADMNDSR
jgi:hypothetical protein